jgi:hypothetical protein
MAISTIGSDALDPVLGIGTTTPSANAKVTLAYGGNQLYLQDTRSVTGVTGLITSNQNGNIYYDANTNNTVTLGGHIWRSANADRMILSSTGRLTALGSTSSGLFLGSESESYSYSGTAPQGGVTEIFRVGSTRLCTSGIFSISATRGSFVHSSMWSWTSTHNGTGQVVLTMLSCGNYTNINVYIDMNSGGSCIISADWGSSQEFMITVHKYTGSTVDFANAGTLWTSPNPSYPTRYSRLTISNGFSSQNGKFDGSLSKGSGTFNIPHPLPALTDSHRLVHSFIEGPQADLIYRGRVVLVDGRAEINIDSSTGMTEGTFEVLCRDVQCFTSNETSWAHVRGSVLGNILTIECQDSTSTASISWMVIGERKDPHMYDTGWTDSEGHPILEPLTNPPQPVRDDYPTQE